MYFDVSQCQLLVTHLKFSRLQRPTILFCFSAVLCIAEDAHLVAAIRTHIATYATSTLACMPDVWHAQRIVLVAPKRVEHNEFLHDRVHEQSTLVQRSRISDRPRGGRNPCVWYVNFRVTMMDGASNGCMPRYRNMSCVRGIGCLRI